MPEEITILDPNRFIPDVGAELDLWQTNIERLSVKAPGLQASGQMPDWWYENHADEFGMGVQIRNEESNPVEVLRYYELYKKSTALISSIYNNQSAGNNDVFAISYTVETLGQENMSAAFRAEPETGTLHQDIINILNDKTASGDSALSRTFEMMSSAYGLDSTADLLAVSGSEYKEKLRSLLHTEGPISRLREMECDRLGNIQHKEKKEFSDKWSAQALSKFTGIDLDEAADYLFSATRSTSDRDRMLGNTLSAFEHFGADRIRDISKTTGIYGIGWYDIPQLELMENLMLVKLPHSATPCLDSNC